MRDTDLAWAAGLIDGEGCISLNAVRTRSKSGRLTYELRVVVNNTDIRLLNRLREVLGVGFICPMKRYSARHRPAWQWEVKSRKAETVIRAVLLYLVGKREEAELGLLSRQYMQPVGVSTENPNAEQLAWLKRELSGLKGHRRVGGGGS